MWKDSPYRQHLTRGSTDRPPHMRDTSPAVYLTVLSTWIYQLFTTPLGWDTMRLHQGLDAEPPSHRTPPFLEAKHLARGTGGRTHDYAS